MRHLLLASCAWLAGCAMGTTIQPRPAEGYPALRFVRTVRLPGALGNTWEFPAGTVLVGDRMRDADAEPLFCGPMTIRDFGVGTQPTCVIRRGDKVWINADSLQRGFERDLPPGTIEEIRF